jgi:aryl-alcohol dehydrogenase-like predicted oxidoreductase
VTLTQLQIAHATHPIATLQSELSVWTRDLLPELLPWCVANDIAVVPFAPLGRGFLTGSISARSEFAADDVRSVNPRFTAQARAANDVIVAGVRAVAARLGATPAQVALAWVLAQGEAVVPIPGATRIEHVDDNVEAVNLTLSAADRKALDEVPPAVGSRY